jgi:histidinol-phosphate aminotransferase
MTYQNNLLETITPYIPSSRYNGGEGPYLKLDWNEATIPPSPLVLKRIDEYLMGGTLNEYPDIHCGQLLSKLEEYTRLPKEQLAVYNGSDDALDNIFGAFIDSSSSVAAFDPGYSQVDSFIKKRTTAYTKLPIEDPFGEHTYPLDELGDYDVVYLINPHSPTGHFFPTVEVERLLRLHPQTLFIVDEAYFEYAKQTCSHLTGKYTNLIVTRTFSKAFSLASCRLGYVISCKENIEVLAKIRNGKSVNSFAQIAGCAALDDVEYMSKYVEEVERAKTFLYSQLIDMETLTAIPSFTNFILIECKDAKALVKKFADANILVRDRSSFKGLENCIRISIGTLSQMVPVHNILSEFNNETK